MRLRAFGLWIAVVLLAMPLGAQQVAVTGTVTGHVLCGDTQRPARFAQVTLFSVPAETQAPKTSSASEVEKFAASLRAAHEGVNLAQGQAGIDGNFVLRNVPPGEYYVLGALPGYVPPETLVQAAFDAGADMKQPLPDVPIVRVIADHAVKADLTLQRGAAVAGRVLWDDGTPAAHTRVKVTRASGKSKLLPPQFAMVGMNADVTGADNGASAYTDDLGQYRIAGLAAGEYVVKATVQMESEFGMKNGLLVHGSLSIENANVKVSGAERESPLVVYAPAAFHRADAKRLKLDAGEEQDDETVSLNVTRLYAVSGQIASAESHHGVSAAMVELEDVQDKEFKRSTMVTDGDGGYFRIGFLPPGSYTLHVTSACDTEPGRKQTTGLPINIMVDHTVRSYEDSQQDVVVMDSDVVEKNVELKPSKVTQKDVDLDDMLKSMR